MDFAARLAEHGCGSPAREALAAYFAAVNAPPGPAKLEGVLAAFEAEGSTVVNNSAAPVSPRAFYDSPSSPVLSEGFRAEPDFASLACSADGRTVAISIRLLPGGREADAFLVGDWFTVGPGGLLQRLLIHGAPAAAPARPGSKRPREPAPAGGGATTAAAAPQRELVLAEAVPYAFTFPLRQTALLLIDFQRDFLLPGGFGESLGNDVSHLMRAVKPAAAALRAARACGMTVAHTREGHVADLSDLHRSKLHRGNPPPGKRIGDVGGMGRILVDGELGCAIVPGEPHESVPAFPTSSRATTCNEPLLRRAGAEGRRVGPAQAGEGRVLQHAARGLAAGARRHPPPRLRRHDRSLRPDHPPRGQRPRFRFVRAGGCVRVLLPAVPQAGAGDVHGAVWDRRLEREQRAARGGTRPARPVREAQ